MKFGVTAGDPYWGKDKACGKALFLLINIQFQPQAPPIQALVTSGMLWADVADPNPFHHKCFYSNICQLALSHRPVPAFTRLKHFLMCFITLKVVASGVVKV